MKKSLTLGSNTNITKISNNSNRNLKRIPRPIGATALAIDSRLNGDTRYQDYIVNQWLIGSGTICGVTMDIFTFSQCIKIPVEVIRTRMRDNLLESKLWDKDKQEQMVTGLLGEMVSWSLEDRMKIQAQINVLTKAQGGKYTPFISAELNKALKLGLDSQSSLQNLLTKVMGGGTTNIFLQQNNIQENQNNYVTSEEVLELLNERNHELDKPEQAKLLETRYDLEDLPEVVATKQEGVDTSKEGLDSKINVTQINQVTDNLKAALAVSDKDHHTMRREIEMKIDTDAEDPELDIYEEDFEPKESFSAMSFLNT